MAAKVKICGITSLEAARTAANDSADFLGFIHFAKSPRHLPVKAMAELMAAIRADGIRVPLVSVVVDPDDGLIDALASDIKPDLIQLHGKETPQKVADILARLNRPAIKVISIGDIQDLDGVQAYEPHVRYLMFDAKTPRNAAMPGGLGHSFDWRIMRTYDGAKPWFLAGGLTPDNVAEALRLSGASMVDVSSGVESAPGVKDSGLISRFLRAAKSL